MEMAKRRSMSKTRSPLLKLPRGRNVGLGCGTLILIAIIVAIFSRAGKSDLSQVTQKLDEMDQRIQRLEGKLDQRLSSLEVRFGGNTDQRVRDLESKLDQINRKLNP